MLDSMVVAFYLCLVLVSMDDDVMMA